VGCVLTVGLLEDADRTHPSGCAIQPHNYSIFQRTHSRALNTQTTQPYAAKSGEGVLAVALGQIEKELSAVKRMLEDCAAKGKLSAFMQVCVLWLVGQGQHRLSRDSLQE